MRNRRRTWKVDERLVALEDELIRYYKDSDNDSCITARAKYNEFKRWCTVLGYTNDEVHQTKQNISGRRY